MEEGQVLEPVQHGLIDQHGVVGVVPGAVEVQVRIHVELGDSFFQGGLTAQVPTEELLVHILEVVVLALPIGVEGDTVKLKVLQQYFHIVVAPLDKDGVIPAPAQEGRAHIQEGGGLRQELLQFLLAVGQQTVGPIVDFSADLGVDIAVEGVHHSAAGAVHLHSGYLNELVKREALAALVPVKGGIPFQIHENKV